MPHHVLAMGTVLAALGAKAAGSAVDPTSLLGTGAAPLSKGMGSTLLSLKAGKAAAIAGAPGSTSFIAHTGGSAVGTAGGAGVAAGASKTAAAAGAAGSGASGGAPISMAAAKGSAAGLGSASTAAATGIKGAGSGAAGTAHPSMLKVCEKTCFRKRNAGLLKGGTKGKAGRPSRSAATGGRRSGPGASRAHHTTQGGASSGGGHASQTQAHQTRGHAPSHGGEGAGRAASGSRGSGFQGSLTGQGGGSTNAGVNYAGGATAEGGEEVMPGPLTSSSHSKFLQLHKGSPTATTAFTKTYSAAPTTPTVTTATTTGAAGAAGAAGAIGAIGPDQAVDASAAAAAAAADRAADASSAAAQIMRAPEISPPALGVESAPAMDPEALTTAAASEPSKASSLFKGFMEGALGVDSTGESGGMLQSLSNGLGQNLFSNWWGDGAMAGGVAAAIGGAAADPTMGAVDPTDFADPTDMMDGEYVEEQTMAVAALLPGLFGRWTGQAKQRTRMEKDPRPTSARLERSDSVASTACASDGATSDSSSCSTAEFISSRRVYRSRVGDRKNNYAYFLC